MKFASEDDNRIPERAFELGSALFRISGRLGRRTFSEHLENRALRLLETSLLGSDSDVRRELRAINELTRLGAEAGLIHPRNRLTIEEEIRSLDAAVGERAKEAFPPEADPKGIFPRAPSRRDSLTAPEEKTALALSSRNGNGVRAERGEARIRQSAILEKIRQSGNLPGGKAGCRIKELQDILPGVSERTLRYDLQNLIEGGAIRRVGNGGPATYYEPTGVPAGLPSLGLPEEGRATRAVS